MFDSSLFKPVSFYNINVSAGDVLFMDDGMLEGKEPDDLMFIPKNIDADFACNLFGTSVANSIPSGAILGFKEVQDWKTYFPGGEFYGVVTKNNLRTVKIAKRIRGNDKELLLIPDPLTGQKDRYDEETVPVDFIVGFYQVVAWAQFERIVM